MMHSRERREPSAEETSIVPKSPAEFPSRRVAGIVELGQNRIGVDVVVPADVAEGLTADQILRGAVDDMRARFGLPPTEDVKVEPTADSPSRTITAVAAPAYESIRTPADNERFRRRIARLVQLAA